MLDEILLNLLFYFQTEQEKIYEAQKIKELTMLPDEMDHGE